MPIRKMTFFNPYKKLPLDIKSAATQVSFSKHLSRNAYAGISTFIEDLKERQGRSFRTESEDESRIWYKLAKGQAIVKNHILYHYKDAVGVISSMIMNHPFWQYVSQRTLLSHIIFRLSHDVKKAVIKQKIPSHLPDAQLFSYLKQSYKQQRENLFEMRTMDSLVALLLLAQMQQKKYNYARPTHAEKLAYVLYLYLFSYKYPIKNIVPLGVRINSILNGISEAETKQSLTNQCCHQSLILELENINELRISNRTESETGVITLEELDIKNHPFFDLNNSGFSNFQTQLH